MVQDRHELVCLDVDGTVLDGIDGPLLPGALDAIAALRRRSPLRFVTNASCFTRAHVAKHLLSLGVIEDERELFTPASVAGEVLRARGHDRGVLLLADAAADDWTWFRRDGSATAVVIASEGWSLTIEQLQPAFRALMAGAAFYTLTRNRYFKVGEALKTDLGPLASFLGYAAKREAEILGKPSAALYDAVAASAGVDRSRILMIGDDAEFDASGAVALGMRGVLVKTGKYREGDEARVEPRPTAVIASLRDL